MAKLKLNLARRPFVNQRPLIALTAASVAILGVLTFWNVHRLAHVLARRQALTQRVAENRAEAESAISATKELREQLVADEAGRVRAVALTVHGVVEKRRLSWSRLFDEVARVLPREVRVQSIMPQFQGKEIRLLLTGTAKDNAAKLRFLTGLQMAPFSSAHLLGDRIDGGQITFDIQCIYDPSRLSSGDEASPEGDGDDSLEVDRVDDAARPRRAEFAPMAGEATTLARWASGPSLAGGELR